MKPAIFAAKSAKMGLSPLETSGQAANGCKCLFRTGLSREISVVSYFIVQSVVSRRATPRHGGVAQLVRAAES
jgi:hypothetical protein